MRCDERIGSLEQQRGEARDRMISPLGKFRVPALKKEREDELST